MQSTSCLINSAIIFARLGDYSTASHVLDEAMPVDDLLALTLFITAHVEFQLGEIQKSQDCFSVALVSLKGLSQDYHRYGLDYTLSAAQIREDLLVAENATTEASGTLTALPADCIFEAPARAGDYATPALSSKRGSSFDSARLPDLSEGGSTPPHSPLSPIERSMEYGQEALTWHIKEDGEEVLELIVEDELAPLSYKKSNPIQVLGGLKRRLSTQKRPSSPTKPVGLPPKRTKKPLQPREPRVQGDSVQELAGFIADLPRQSQLDPRNAEAEHGNVNELAAFFHAGPKPQPLSLPARPSRQKSTRGSAASSLYSLDQRADSVRSAELATWGDNVSVRSGSPSPSPYRYRSGVGSYLSQGSAPGSRAPSRSPLSREVEPTSYFPDLTSQPHERPTESLHPSINDTISDASWPLTPEVAESLSNLSLNSREGSIRSLPDGTPSILSKQTTSSPSVPARKSSLLRAAVTLNRPGSSSRMSFSTSAKKTAPSVMSNGQKKSVGGTFRFLNGMGHG